MLDKSIDAKINLLKKEIVKDICDELKRNIIQTWKDGTDRFYNDAKSLVSDYSRPQSVAASEIGISRSVSKDFNNFQPKVPSQVSAPVKSTNSIFGQEYESLSDESLGDARQEGDVTPKGKALESVFGK
jgi:hypothetical protein